MSRRCQQLRVVVGMPEYGRVRHEVGEPRWRVGAVLDLLVSVTLQDIAIEGIVDIVSG